MAVSDPDPFEFHQIYSDSSVQWPRRGQRVLSQEWAWWKCEEGH